MQLDEVDYGRVFCAPGARGFFGEGYPWHRYAKLAGMTWKDTTFVAKTTTLEDRAGNMPLDERDHLTPKEFNPKCIEVKFRSGHVLNAVGLSGPGARWLLDQGRWQARTEPFMISFMTVGATKADRLEELRQFVKLLQKRLSSFRAPVALQINLGCPNTGHPPEELYAEIEEMLEIAAVLRIPIVINYNPLVTGEQAFRTAEHPACSALWIANTIPWGTEGIDWQGIFGSTESPLTKRGLPAPGGLSGPKCLSFTIRAVMEARWAGVKKPIVAGNGVQRPYDVQELLAAGAKGIALGVVGLVRPWRMRKIIATQDRKVSAARL